MSVILIMIPGAMVLAALGVWAFINAAKKGQFDDLDTPAIRAVFDDDCCYSSYRDDGLPQNEAGVVMDEVQELAKKIGEAVENAVEFRGNLTHEITPAVISATAKIPFKLVMYRELLMHRSAELGETAAILYTQRKYVSAIVLARAVFEVAGVMYYLHKKIKKSLDDQDSASLDELAMKGLFGTKDESSPYAAVNILTAIDHLNKEVDGLSEMYAFLCEHAHPNFAGVMGAHQGRDPNGAQDPYATIQLGASGDFLDPSYGLSALKIALTLVFNYQKYLSDLDADVVSLCESALPNQ